MAGRFSPAVTAARGFALSKKGLGMIETPLFFLVLIFPEMGPSSFWGQTLTCCTEE